MPQDTAALQAFTPAQIATLQRRMLPFFGPWRWLTEPSFEGLEHIPDTGPAMFVGNHTVLGFFDWPLIVREIAERKGFVVRVLGGTEHFKMPWWRDLMLSFGAVSGTRENSRALLASGQQVMVFPGGSGEVLKGKGSAYTLHWKDRTGFAKLAIEHGCPVIPFAALGGDDCYQIRGGRRLKFYAGLGSTLFPRPQRMYFRFGAPISTAELGGDVGQAAALRDRVKQHIEDDLLRLQRERTHDPARSLVYRINRKIGSPQ